MHKYHSVCGLFPENVPLRASISLATSLLLSQPTSVAGTASPGLCILESDGTRDLASCFPAVGHQVIHSVFQPRLPYL